MNAVAIAFNGSDVGVMSKAVKESGDGSSVRKDLVPVVKFAVGGDDDDGTALVPSIDDFVKEVGGIVVVRKVGEFINNENMG